MSRQPQPGMFDTWFDVFGVLATAFVIMVVAFFAGLALMFVAALVGGAL